MWCSNHHIRNRMKKKTKIFNTLVSHNNEDSRKRGDWWCSGGCGGGGAGGGVGGGVLNSTNNVSTIWTLLCVTLSSINIIIIIFIFILDGSQIILFHFFQFNLFFEEEEEDIKEIIKYEIPHAKYPTKRVGKSVNPVLAA